MVFISKGVDYDFGDCGFVIEIVKWVFVMGVMVIVDFGGEVKFGGW